MQGNLVCRGLFYYAATVLAHDCDAWVQQRCSAGARAVCTAAPSDLPVWRRCQAHGLSTTEVMRHAGQFGLPRLVVVWSSGA